MNETNSNTFARRFASDQLAPYSACRTNLGDMQTNVARVYRAPPGYYEHPPYDGIAVYMALSRCVGRVDVGDGVFEMAAQARDFFVGVPGSGGKMDSFRGGHGMQVIISPKALTASVAESGQQISEFPRFHRSFHNHKTISNLMLHIASIGLSEGDTDPLNIDALVLELIGALKRVSEVCSRQSREAAALNSKAVAEIVEFMEAHLSEAISLEQLAKLADLPLTTFLRAFRTAVGETPYQHLLRRRLEAARRSLMSSHQSIAEIAFENGFSSQQHLTGLFSERFGISPAAFRKQVLRQEVIEHRSTLAI